MLQNILNRIKKVPPKQLVTIVIVVMAFFFLLNLNFRLSSVFTNRQSVGILQTEVVGLYATDVDLRTELASAQSEQIIEQFGRESGFILDEDIPVAVIGVEGNLPDLTQEGEMPGVPQYDNWELWWYLLFGKLFQ